MAYLEHYGCKPAFKQGEKVILLRRKKDNSIARKTLRIIYSNRIDSISFKSIQKLATKEVYFSTSDTVQLVDGSIYWTSQVCLPKEFRKILKKMKNDLKKRKHGVKNTYNNLNDIILIFKYNTSKLFRINYFFKSLWFRIK